MVIRDQVVIAKPAAAPVTDVHHRDDARVVVDPVDDLVGAAPGAEPVVRRWKQPLADAVWLFE